MKPINDATQAKILNALQNLAVLFDPDTSYVITGPDSREIEPCELCGKGNLYREVQKIIVLVEGE